RKPLKARLHSFYISIPKGQLFIFGMCLQMRSYIKLFGPNIDQALSELEALVKELGQLEDGRSAGIRHEEEKGFFSRFFGKKPQREIISDFDFEFSWSEEPTVEEMTEFIKYVDERLEAVGTRYTITSLLTEIEDFPVELEDQVVSYIKFYGPNISKALEAVHKALMDLPEMTQGDILEGETTIGLFDYAFAWNMPPRVDQIRKVIRTIDRVIAASGARYTITTRSRKEVRPVTVDEKRKTRALTAKHVIRKDFQEIIGQPR
ncbi:MAG: hypothetical protein ACFFB3_19560, partial [Candidatus Hodarchaeota archaeon]